MPQAPARVASSSASSLSASLIQEEIQPANNTLQEPTMPAPRNASHHFVRAKEEPPYSFSAEVDYFFKQGVPLVLSGVLEWGVPPLSAMVIAGHVKEGSVTLQAAIGFSRVYYNVTCLMPCISLLAYIRTVVPGCVGAQRIDRIPRYFQRSMLLSFALLIPSLVLQLFSEQFLLAVNVPSDVAAAVGTYTRIMILTACIFLLECHLEQLFISLGFAKVDAFIGFLSGLGIDIGCTYWWVHVKGYGMYGMALKEIAVKLSRVLLWLIFAGVFGLWQTLFVPSRIARLEPLLSRREVRIFFSQVLPKYIQSLSGWLIFELQVCPSEVEYEARAASCDVLLNSSLPSASTRDSPADGLSNVPGMTAAGRAAGAIWVQVESALASSMSGWITVANLRTQKLLGRLDASGAAKSFLVHNVLAAVIVGLLNTLPLLVFDQAISKLVSNDLAVSSALEPLLWVLACHAQTRITNLTTGNLLIPVGKPWLNVFTTFFAFYIIGAPFAALGAFTNVLTTVTETKMLYCVGCTSIAQTVLCIIYVAVLCRLDWSKTARIVHGRAQSDQGQQGRATGGASLEAS